MLTLAKTRTGPYHVPRVCNWAQCAAILLTCRAGCRVLCNISMHEILISSCQSRANQHTPFRPHLLLSPSSRLGSMWSAPGPLLQPLTACPAPHLTNDYTDGRMGTHSASSGLSFAGPGIAHRADCMGCCFWMAAEQMLPSELSPGPGERVGGSQHGAGCKVCTDIQH